MRIASGCKIALIACGLLGVGCQSTGGKAKPASSQAATSAVPMQMTVFAHAEHPDDPRDPQPQLRAMVHLDIFYLDMPPESVSGNTDFWKRVDEDAVGVGSRDLLAKNGIRSGVVPRSEAAFFDDFFQKIPHYLRKSRVDGLAEQTITMEMEMPFDREDLFVYRKGLDQPVGRSYSHGVNNLRLTFGPTPRNPSAVRMTICPFVHSDRQHMQFTTLNREYQTTETEDDHIYDLSLTADVPEDSFFILAPGSDASRRMSVGSCFLIKATPTERREQVILLVPTFLRVDGKPMLVRDPVVK